MITIIDYGMGNLRSVQKAVEMFYPEVKISSLPGDILSSEKVIFPGVGAFGNAMEELTRRGLADAIIKFVGQGKPFLGICLGIQLLFTDSEEASDIKGLGILKGRVKRFGLKQGLKIPHMGWNKIYCTKAQGHKDTGKGSEILSGIPDGSYMYFVHSYFVEPEDTGIILCETEYGGNFVSGIAKDNIYAFQFHPEKSQTLGLKIIENFVKF